MIGISSGFKSSIEIDHYPVRLTRPSTEVAYVADRFISEGVTTIPTINFERKGTKGTITRCVFKIDKAVANTTYKIHIFRTLENGVADDSAPAKTLSEMGSYLGVITISGLKTDVGNTVSEGYGTDWIDFKLDDDKGKLYVLVQNSSGATLSANNIIDLEFTIRKYL